MVNTDRRVITELSASLNVGRAYISGISDHPTVRRAACTLPSALKIRKPSIPFLLCANGPTRSNGTFSKSASGNQAQRCSRRREEADFSPKLHVGPPPHVGGYILKKSSKAQRFRVLE